VYTLPVTIDKYDKLCYNSDFSNEEGFQGKEVKPLSYLGGIMLIVGGIISRPLFNHWAGTDVLSDSFFASLCGNVIALLVVGFGLIALDKSRDKSK